MASRFALVVVSCEYHVSDRCMRARISLAAGSVPFLKRINLRIGVILFGSIKLVVVVSLLR